MLVPMKTDEHTPRRYDAVIVLGMNIRKTEAGYRPTTYADHDQYGMLAGEMNTIAAQLLHEQQATDTFVFSTGSSEKTKAAFGPDVPTEAEIYNKDFLKRIAGSSQPKPVIILEDRSVNTYSNLTECIDIINEQGWQNIAIMSARYHIPRVKMLWEFAQEKHPAQARAEFLIAEDIIQQATPGVYDELIDAAYRSPEGQKRLASEAQGLQDMKDGKYVVTEFQFAKQ
jgi:hypothetical protein